MGLRKNDRTQVGTSNSLLMLERRRPPTNPKILNDSAFRSEVLIMSAAHAQGCIYCSV